MGKRWHLIGILLLSLAVPFETHGKSVLQRASSEVRFLCRLLFGGEQNSQKMIEEARLSPVRDWQQDPAYQSYREKRKIYLSLTTSPDRIRHVPSVLEIFDPRDYDGILISIPEIFQRTQQTYTIPEELLSNPRVTILRTGNDLGPVMKMLVPIEKLRGENTSAIVISIDDDIAYAPSMINELGMAAHATNSVVSGSGASYKLWGINADAKLFKNAIAEAPKRDTDLIPVDVVEGFGAIAYPVELIPTDLIRNYAARSKATRLSDDLVISWALGLRGVPRFILFNPFYNRSKLWVLPYGKGVDALHRGAGTSQLTSQGWRKSFENVNKEKYQASTQHLPGLSVK